MSNQRLTLNVVEAEDGCWFATFGEVPRVQQMAERAAALRTVTDTVERGEANIERIVFRSADKTSTFTLQVPDDRSRELQCLAAARGIRWAADRIIGPGNAILRDVLLELADQVRAGSLQE